MVLGQIPPAMPEPSPQGRELVALPMTSHRPETAQPDDACRRPLHIRRAAPHNLLLLRARRLRTVSTQGDATEDSTLHVTGWALATLCLLSSARREGKKLLRQTYAALLAALQSSAAMTPRRRLVHATPWEAAGLLRWGA